MHLGSAHEVQNMCIGAKPANILKQHSFAASRLHMNTILRLTLAFVAAGSLFAAEQTWTGAISDSACGLSHAKMMAEHKALANDKACTLVVSRPAVNTCL